MSSKRKTAVAALLRKAFEAAVEQLGQDDAKRVWRNVLRTNSSKRGRPVKNELSGWEALYLEIYDEMANDPHSDTLIRYLGSALYKHNKRQKHASPAALERRLRRLIAEIKSGKLIREDGPDGLKYTRGPHRRGR
jgi:hypothetical protein